MGGIILPTIISKGTVINMSKPNAAIIFGGRSKEHDVSIQSAKSVIKNINTDKYNIHLIGITRKGEWKLYNGTAEQLENWESNSTKIVIPPDTSYNGYFCIDTPEIIHKIDVAFLVMHGTYAEDGTIQSVFELAGIPYVGCGVLASAATMDKVIAKQICGYNNIPQCKFCSATKSDWLNDSDKILNNFESELGYPIFIKPANMGSSVGISKAKNRDELIKSINEAFRFDRKIIAEEFIDGREIECAVIGNDECTASIPGEVISAKEKEFYDYEAKYDDKFDSEIQIPAKLSEDKLNEIRALAIKTYKTLNCTGLSRVDFFVTNKDSRVLLNEVNSLPGFTKISMYPKMIINMGIPYDRLIDKLFELAIENYKDKSKIEY